MLRKLRSLLSASSYERRSEVCAVSEMASEIAEAIRGFTAAVDRLSGVMAWGVVQDLADTHGRQSEMAAVVLKFAHEGYFHTRVDGLKVCEADAAEARRMLDKVFSRGKR